MMHVLRWCEARFSVLTGWVGTYPRLVRSLSAKATESATSSAIAVLRRTVEAVVARSVRWTLRDTRVLRRPVLLPLHTGLLLMLSTRHGAIMQILSHVRLPLYLVEVVPAFEIESLSRCQKRAPVHRRPIVAADRAVDVHCMVTFAPVRKPSAH